MLVAGIDGAAGGWVAVRLRDGRFAGADAAPGLAELLAGLDEAAAIGIDMPIGLPESGMRPVDVEARRALGPRRSSVFLTPPRAVLQAATFADAVAEARDRAGAGISQQSYALRHKIFEVEALAKADERLVEVHPELSFLRLAGVPARERKRSWNGLHERLALLRRAGIELPPALPAGRVAVDDLVDAAAVAWSAARHARGQAVALPAGARRGARGTIWS